MAESGAILSIPVAQTKGLKQLVLKDPYGELLLVAMPADQSTTSPQLNPRYYGVGGELPKVVYESSHKD